MSALIDQLIIQTRYNLVSLDQSNFAVAPEFRKYLVTHYSLMLKRLLEEKHRTESLGPGPVHQSIKRAYDGSIIRHVQWTNDLVPGTKNVQAKFDSSDPTDAYGRLTEANMTPEYLPAFGAHRLIGAMPKWTLPAYLKHNTSGPYWQ